MITDPGNLMRLRGSMRSVIGSISNEGAMASGGDALADALDATRSEVLALLASPLKDEFERLFPIQQLRRGGLPGDQLGTFTTATASLARMAGWIDGLLAEAELAQQIAANAEAYAEAKMRQERGRERGMGFRPERG